MENKIVLNDKTLSWFLAIMIVSNVTIFSFNLEALYYIILFSCLIITIHQSKIYSINFSILLLYAVCALSILVNNVPYFFKSWERLVSFIFITAFISPLFFSYFINRIRIRLFQYSQSLLQIVVIASFILNCLGINLTGREDFCGVTVQSMLLAPISANVTITSLYKITRKNTNHKIYFLVTFIISILTLFLTASRAAVIATIISITVYLVIIYRNKIGKLIKLSITVIILLILSFQIWSPYLINIEKKNTNSIVSGGMTSSRDELWNDRIQEFKSSPFFGIGFASISTKSNNHYYNKEDGKVETGSSWLNILSMTGLIGVFIFCYIWIKTLYLIYINLNRFPYTSSYLAALIIFWSIHMGAEGYIYAAGSFLFFLLWLLIGYIYTIFSHPKYVLLINF